MSNNTTARLAGFVYLLLVITGIYNLIYVPSQLINMQDAVATVENISNNELLFRSGIVVGILSYIIYLILPFVLFKLFQGINRDVAVMMVVLSVVSVPVSLFNIVHKVDVLTLLSNASFLSQFDVQTIQAKVMLSLKSYNNGIAVVQIFWGLWLLPFGYLAFKSGYVPRILGVCLMLGCFGYLTVFLTNMLFPEITIPSVVSKPASIGEIGTCLWLLILGNKPIRILEKG
ncbi:DUF4386 domain-containing protein [Pseudoalteromonas phenolica]|uniref:DUF4386 domain-containing protein n=1 Tax=Pseudoalteromonas phenolica TaxID=161398 RepID=A0A5S3YQ83_9GAMM|nr:DUF4386 domain-containing protein [Pseudoalteromonas phenolica]TMP78019.1 DUF4386 domain-containing protein [Pseudoalteromonas phenolica]